MAFLSLSRSRMRLPALIFVALLFIAAPANSDVQASQRAEAARANNLGTALMNQQLLEKAAAKFADAYQLDPALVQAEVNRGIALVYLQKMPEAKEALGPIGARVGAASRSCGRWARSSIPQRPAEHP